MAICLRYDVAYLCWRRTLQYILVYSDSLTWGIIPTTRQRLPFDARWPGVMELTLNGEAQTKVRVIEDCLNGRRTVFEDPFKAGRNGLQGLSQRIEVNSPLALVILMLGTNDFQSMHPHNAWHTAQGIATLINAIRTAPIEPGMPMPDILVVAPPAIQTAAGPMADKFSGGDQKCAGLAKALQQVCSDLHCHFFDAGRVVDTSKLDGVHLDQAEHMTLGKAIAETVRPLL